MQAELTPCQHLEQFIQRARPAGEGDKGICALEHDGLALMHCIDGDQFGKIITVHLAAPKMMRDHPGDMGTTLQRRPGDAAHQTDLTTAINQGHPPPGDTGTNRLRRFRKSRVISVS